jgi:hypothetical protein
VQRRDREDTVELPLRVAVNLQRIDAARKTSASEQVGSHKTLRWREMDSNPRSPKQGEDKRREIRPSGGRASLGAVFSMAAVPALMAAIAIFAKGRAETRTGKEAPAGIRGTP